MSVKLSLRNRVVVTGIGLVSPTGSDLNSFWQSVIAPTAPQHDGKPDFRGHIDDFGTVSPQTKRVIRKSLKLMNRETQLGVAAAQKAIDHSGILEASYQSDRVGVCFGAGNVEIRQDDFVGGVEACRQAIGEFDSTTWGQFGIPHVDPLWILRVLPNMPACHAAIANDFRGPNNTITQGSVATNMAINEARYAIIDDDADVMVVGGTGTGFTQDVSAQENLGFQPSEAAAAFVLERMDRAIQRGACLLGEILSATSATMIHRDHRANPQAATKAVVSDALKQSQVSADRVGFISSDSSIDDDQAGSLSGTPRLSTMQRVGDAAAGSSALGLVASLLSLQHDGDDQEQNATIAMNVNASENGLASCVVLGSVFQRAAA